jgi:hypothetical protein
MSQEVKIRVSPQLSIACEALGFPAQELIQSFVDDLSRDYEFGNPENFELSVQYAVRFGQACYNKGPELIKEMFGMLQRIHNEYYESIYNGPGKPRNYPGVNNPAIYFNFDHWREFRDKRCIELGQNFKDFQFEFEGA